MIMILKQKKRKLKPWLNLNHNIQIVSLFQGKLSCKQDNKVLSLFHTVAVIYFLAAEVQHDD